MKIAIIGYGKMGRMIESLTHETKDEVVFISDKSRPFSPEEIRNSGAEVAIEFTEPASAMINISKCFDAGIPVVTGTTGWLDRLPEVEEECENKEGTLFYASNFSIGVNLFFQLNKYLATLMNEQRQYQVSMEEIHHTEKKDAPSGTAITLAEGLIQNLESKTEWMNSESENEHELSILSKRLPEVPGTHSIKFESEEDFIEIKHEAKGREGFARGAMSAARWVRNKSGVFTMSDFLQL